jgi:hypothetical protein
VAYGDPGQQGALLCLVPRLFLPPWLFVDVANQPDVNLSVRALPNTLNRLLETCRHFLYTDREFIVFPLPLDAKSDW